MDMTHKKQSAIVMDGWRVTGVPAREELKGYNPGFIPTDKVYKYHNNYSFIKELSCLPTSTTKLSLSAVHLVV